ncbi:MAG: methyl-accepting chemotaxis protein [Treponema sp.]|jgi:methyl-accepting chemotaxis protein|nr:methyl-accepting chemotaxis protein [Treponema sp.]
MKLSMKLTIINAMLTIMFVAVIAIVILSRSITFQRNAAMENMNNLASSIAKDIQSRYQAYVQVAKTLAHIMNSYEKVDVEVRRTRYEEILFSVFDSYPNFTGIYTLWMPNALDGQDAEYASTLGSSETGQFIPYYTRESGSIELKAYSGYQGVLNSISRQDVISNPFFRVIQGKQILVIDIQVPIIRPDQVIVGIAGIQLNIDDLQPLIESIRPYGTGHGTVYAHDGTIAAHYRQEQRGTYFQNTSVGVLGQDGVTTVLDSIHSGEPATVIANNVILVSYPFYLGNSTVAWTVMSLAPLKTVLGPVYALIQFSIIFIIGAGIAAAIIIFLTSNSLAKRIIRVGEMMKDISEGEGDLTKRLTIHAQDEIGNMGSHFNETLDKIHNLVVNIKQQSGSLVTIGTELSANMAKTAATITEIATTIQSVQKQTSRQAGSVNQTSETMRKIIASIEQLNQHLETQAGHITQSSSAIEQMLANIASVTQTLVKNDENVKRLSQVSDAGRTGLQEVSTDIQEIAKESEGLLEITAVMESIASQTNLLSMNAAIEAAHAGESGKGFAVVADEIRKLAESSSEQSNTIASVLKKIKESIDKIALSTDAVIERFEAIDRSVKIVSDQEEQIRRSMEEQGTGSKQILESISKLNDISHIIKEDSGQMRAGSREILAESKNLEILTEEINQGMQGMASGAEQINTAVQRVHDLSGENKRHIDVLVNEISKFKVEG